MCGKVLCMCGRVHDFCGLCTVRVCRYVCGVCVSVCVESLNMHAVVVQTLALENKIGLVSPCWWFVCQG